MNPTVNKIVLDRKHRATREEAHNIVDCINHLEYEHAEQMIQRVITKPRKKIDGVFGYKDGWSKT